MKVFTLTRATTVRGLTVVFGALAMALAAGSVQAQGHHGGGGGGFGGHGGYVHGGGYRGGYGPFWGGVGLGVGLGLGAYYGAPWYYPGYVVTEPAPVYYEQPQPVVTQVQPVPPVTTEPAPMATMPAAPSNPEPVIYPRNGQGAKKTETDRKACDHWAGTQRNASTDIIVYQRAMSACMDARGYTLR